MPNGETLNAADKTIDEALKNKRLSKTDYAILTALRYLVSTNRSMEKKVKENSEKLEQMWPAYRYGKWVVLGIGGVALIDLATRSLTLLHNVELLMRASGN